MPPKKKGNRKDDDWDADLGETVDPIAQATAQAKADDAANDAEEDDEAAAGSGGLLAALKKNRGRKAKKGKVVEDFVEGEDPGEADGTNGYAETPQENLAPKAPQEADMDEEGVFDQPQKKGKGGKQQKGGKQTAKKDEDEEEEATEGGGLKSKKEKEKEKKEREKQRKKEQVSSGAPIAHSRRVC